MAYEPMSSLSLRRCTSPALLESGHDESMCQILWSRFVVGLTREGD